MRNTLIKQLFPLFALLLLAPWPIAYAYDNGASAEKEVQIRVADAALAPKGTVFGKATGGITRGDLFYLDTAGRSADIVSSLHLTNAAELSRCFSYMILKVGIYAERQAGQWEKVTLPDTFITMQNAQTSFTVGGYANYKMTIDSGSFYCTNIKACVSPQFYLTVE